MSKPTNFYSQRPSTHAIAYSIFSDFSHALKSRLYELGPFLTQRLRFPPTQRSPFDSFLPRPHIGHVTASSPTYGLVIFIAFCAFEIRVPLGNKLLSMFLLSACEVFGEDAYLRQYFCVRWVQRRIVDLTLGRYV